jgi:hypothetical protein
MRGQFVGRQVMGRQLMGNVAHRPRSPETTMIRIPTAM